MRRWLLAGCVVMACGDNAPHVPTREVMAVPAMPTTKLDLLFVVSNESNTVDFQLQWIDAFPALLAEISVDGRPDLHVGAISPDMGTSVASGAFGADIGGTINGCHATGDNGALFSLTDVPYLIDSATTTNHPNALTDDLPHILDLGPSGCGYQQHLAAVRAAFTNPANVGFRRDDAALGIVIVSDEDDCSALDVSLFDPDTSTLGALQHFRCTQFGVVCAEPDMTTPGPRTGCIPASASTIIEDPSDFISTIRGLASDPRRVAFASVIAPPTTVEIELRAPPGSTSTIPALRHGCDLTNPDTGLPVDAADPAVRLAWLADQFGDRGTQGSVCDYDLHAAATNVGIGLRRAMGTSCIDEGIDLGQCVVSDDNDVELPRCGSATTTDCYDVATDATTCPHGSHAKLVVHHDAAYTLVRC